ncbi:hypothetical protein LEN26_007827, partial [Aphanomyces euteiches]
LARFLEDAEDDVGVAKSGAVSSVTGTPFICIFVISTLQDGRDIDFDAIDDDEDFPNVVSNSVRHENSKWNQLYKSTIHDTFVHQNITPILERFESIDPFRRSKKRFTVGDFRLPHLQQEARHRHDPAAALKRRRRPECDLTAAVAVNGGHEVADLSQISIERLLFNGKKWRHNVRCEYCDKDGGDLKCALCNVIAHTSCYLDAWQHVKQRGRTSFNQDGKWICIACEDELQQDYDVSVAARRRNTLKAKETSCAVMIAGYMRMSREAKLFVRKLARNAFNEMQRLRIRPYTVDLIRLRGLGSNEAEIITADGTVDEETERRLPNGFLCNPYVVFHIVEDHDEDTQRFCFESEIQRGLNDVEWHEEIFVPGVNGNVTMCFTVLSKNGPNNFFLGQGSVRLSGTEIWRYGATLDVKLKSELEIIPKIGHHQLMRIQDIGSLDKELTLSIRIRHYSEIGSYCGYMQSINTVDSVKGNSRWCVLADGTFRIYR